jgi:SAM-dependent methyltransferase
MNDVIAGYTRFYVGQNLNKAYPSEWLVRIFMGCYPRLCLDRTQFEGRRLVDISCGDGRNLGLFADLGFEVYGTEVSQEICAAVGERLERGGVRADLRVGTNAALPFEDEFLDYAVSWNACYYMPRDSRFDDYVNEFARVLTPTGRLILSIPKPSNFIYRDAAPVADGYVKITSDPYGIREGSVMRRFADEAEIEASFAARFEDFVFGSSEMDSFGVRNDHFIVVCRKSPA